MSSTPAVSVALCTFNAGAYLEPQIQSILNQSLPPAELVVGDDGSTDDTVPFLQALAARAPFPVRIQVNPSRLGPAQNFTQTINRCDGPYIALCDQDDVWLPHKLRSLTRALETTGAALAFSDLRLVGDNTPPGQTQWGRLGFGPADRARCRDGRGLRVLLRYNVITGASVCLRKTLANVALPVPAETDFLHDEWLGLLAAATTGLALVDEPLVDYRQHGAQQVGAAASGVLNQLRYARAKMGPAYFVAMARRAQALVDKLHGLPPSALAPDALNLAEQKLRHANARLTIHHSMLLRWPLTLAQAVQGRYWKFGYGVKSLVQDLFL